MLSWTRIALIVALSVVAREAQAQSSASADVDTATVRASFREQAVRHPNTAWLRKNASVIRSIDPQDHDFSDLEPLRRAIGDARVVMLGEQTHGDGSTFVAKHRLIRFLHEQMGFSVLAFENPVYDSEKMWGRLQAGDSTFRQGMFGLWSRVDQVAPLFDYLEQRARTSRPLRLVGVDPQSHLQISRDSLLIDLRWTLGRAGLDSARLGDSTAFGRAVDTLTHYRAPWPWVVDSLAVLDKELRTGIAALPPNEALATMARVVTSLANYAKQVRVSNEADSIASTQGKYALWAAGNAFRDEQMGHNLVWLARSRFPDQKIIVWASSAHTAYRHPYADERDLPSREGLGEGLRVGPVPLGYRPMGQVVREALGDSVYSIMPTSYDGVAGTPVWRGQKSYPFEVHTDYNARPDLDFEDWMNAAGFRYALVDLRRPRRGGEWLQRPFVARPQGNVAVRAPWAQATDAFLFIRTQHPATQGCPMYRDRELGIHFLNDHAVPEACLPK